MDEMRPTVEFGLEVPYNNDFCNTPDRVCCESLKHAPFLAISSALGEGKSCS